MRLAPGFAGLSALVAVLVPVAGCGPLGALGSVLGGGSAAGAYEAHVLYQMREGCTTLVARTLRDGYTVMTPLDRRVAFEPTGVFEGPVRTGESVFRYLPPGRVATWPADAAEVPMAVHAVRRTLPEARARLLAACGAALGTDGPADGIPRIPGPPPDAAPDAAPGA